MLCPRCSSGKIVKNGAKPYGNKQNHLCKDCGRQFIGDHTLTYKGCHSKISEKIKLLTVRGSGVRDIAVTEKISVGKVLTTLIDASVVLKPKSSFYTSLRWMNSYRGRTGMFGLLWDFAYHANKDYRALRAACSNLKSSGHTFMNQANVNRLLLSEDFPPAEAGRYKIVVKYFLPDGNRIGISTIRADISTH